MKISTFKIKNYRRLADVSLVLGDQKTILVGANNSGKTSCIGALHTFLVRPENLRVRDISKKNWRSIIDIGNNFEQGALSTTDLEVTSAHFEALLPSLDVTIHAASSEAYIAREILPDLEWKGGDLAVRITYEPTSISALYEEYIKAREVVKDHKAISLWPKNLFDFIEKGRNFSKHFKQSHHIISANCKAAVGLVQPLSSSALRKLIRVDVISEQRGLGNEDGGHQTGPYSEKQRLNKLLRDYYDRFLNPDDFPEVGDLEVLQKQQEMEDGFTKRLGQQFASPLLELEEMGYPGIGGNPRVEIAARISGTDALQRSSSVRYRFDKDDDDTLPESYLGLGYQNLIYLTFRLMEFRDRWMRVGKSISSDEDLTEQIEPIHLVLVEEPEVNLHAQVQRVFVAKASETLRKHPRLGNSSEYQTQIVVSTHSSHIINDVDFKDLRYFRRSSKSDAVKMDHSVIENMSELFTNAGDEMKFVRKHLKLTHCDIFFADGVIFVEGTAERILIPEFIQRQFKELSKRYLSVLEVSGAHTHKYRALIEKLGVITLVVTDLDSVGADGKKCFPKREDNQSTNNDTLKSWHPCKTSVDDLIDISKNGREKVDSHAPVFIAYQRPSLLGKSEILTRTFEDALLLENWENTYFKKAKEGIEAKSIPIDEAVFQFVQGLSKGDFAFDCLLFLAEKDENYLLPPGYIQEGLEWIEGKLSPTS